MRQVKEKMKKGKSEYLGLVLMFKVGEGGREEDGSHHYYL